MFDIKIGIGGDPRGFREFAELRNELAKLSHPACPDVDWAKVEQLCLTLFKANGAELQTLAYLVLARSRRYGLNGLKEGMALLKALCSQWHQVWPSSEPARLEILNSFFAQLQILLRSTSIGRGNAQALSELDAQIGELAQILARQRCEPVAAMQALRGQLANFRHRLEQSANAGQVSLQLPQMTDDLFLMPSMILLAPCLSEQAPTNWGFKSRKMLCSFALGLVFALGGCLAWKIHSSAEHVTAQGFIDWFQNEPVIPTPVRLDSLSLFNPGSTELKPESTKVLVNALVSIKARTDWLIVIAGHTDSTGDAAQNLNISYARASAVRDWMQTMSDIPGNCFAVQGFAATQPLASNDTEAGRETNRRVDIRLVPHTGACE